MPFPASACHHSTPVKFADHGAERGVAVSADRCDDMAEALGKAVRILCHHLPERHTTLSGPSERGSAVGVAEFHAAGFRGGQRLKQAQTQLGTVQLGLCLGWISVPSEERP